jgi:citrate synthase
MQMFLEIGTADRVESYVKTQLEVGEKILGLDHAVCNVDDPRLISWFVHNAVKPCRRQKTVGN